MLAFGADATRGRSCQIAGGQPRSQGNDAGGPERSLALEGGRQQVQRGCRAFTLQRQRDILTSAARQASCSRSAPKPFVFHPSRQHSCLRPSDDRLETRTAALVWAGCWLPVPDSALRTSPATAARSLLAPTASAVAAASTSASTGAVASTGTVPSASGFLPLGCCPQEAVVSPLQMTRVLVYDKVEPLRIADLVHLLQEAQRRVLATKALARTTQTSHEQRTNTHIKVNIWPPYLYNLTDTCSWEGGKSPRPCTHSPHSGVPSPRRGCIRGRTPE